MKTNTAGITLIRQFEGCEIAAYRCAAGVLTIGFGHTGPDVLPGMVISNQRATELLQEDLARFEAAVSKAVRVVLTPNQFGALVSLTYNIGPAAFRKSTLLKKLNAGATQAAADQFLVWNRAGGRVLAGLTRRREAERALFLHP